MSAEWRDTHIIPRYHAAGVRKFAFYMSESMPMIGAPPAAEGPAFLPRTSEGGMTRLPG
jgi:hypothetical protein